MFQSILSLREELYHPIVSHFPIVLISLSLVTKFIELVVRKYCEEHHKSLQAITRFMLFSAPLFFLLAMFLGDSALDIIKNDLSSLTMVYQHEDASYMALYFLLAAIVFEVLSMVEQIKFKKIASLLCLFTLLIANYYLVQAAHLGGKLVYEQGAAVLGR